MSELVVTPLVPPFTEAVMHFQFLGYEKLLVVSKQEGLLIEELLGYAPIGREIVIAPAGDGVRVRISVVQ